MHAPTHNNNKKGIIFRKASAHDKTSTPKKDTLPQKKNQKNINYRQLPVPPVAVSYGSSHKEVHLALVACRKIDPIRHNCEGGGETVQP